MQLVPKMKAPTLGGESRRKQVHEYIFFVGSLVCILPKLGDLLNFSRHHQYAIFRFQIQVAVRQYRQN